MKWTLHAKSGEDKTMIFTVETERNYISVTNLYKNSTDAVLNYTATVVLITLPHLIRFYI